MVWSTYTVKKCLCGAYSMNVCQVQVIRVVFLALSYELKLHSIYTKNHSPQSNLYTKDYRLYLNCDNSYSTGATGVLVNYNFFGSCTGFADNIAEKNSLRYLSNPSSEQGHSSTISYQPSSWFIVYGFVSISLDVFPEGCLLSFLYWNRVRSLTITHFHNCIE